MTVKILGGGCASCKKLSKMATKALKELKLDVTVEKEEDFQVIMNDYKVMTTPALVVNDQVIIKGRVPSYKEVLEAIDSEQA